MKKTFYMMRHGETLFNVRGKIQGSCDSPLTELGIKQAQAAAELLKDVEFTDLYSSTAERACDTLELVVGGQRSYHRLKGLKERDFGVFEGESEALNPRWPNGYDEMFPRFGGETTADVKNRLRKTCLDIMESEGHESVLAVSHAGACNQFMMNWLTKEEMKEKNISFGNCVIFKYEYENQKFSFVEMLQPVIE